MASLNPALLETLKTHIAMGLRQNENGEELCAIQLHLQAIEGELAEVILLETQDGNQGNYDVQLERLLSEKLSLKAKLETVQPKERHGENEQARLEETFAELDRLRHHPIEWDNVIIRQMIECVRVLSKDWLRISFRVGGEMEAHLAS
jgi:hypothetical protein